jgi:hypothetical protein
MRSELIAILAVAVLGNNWILFFYKQGIEEGDLPI